jgi:prepilin-type N-terminal cleavage/methylation domain-containing protein/prepilin-type processing-associated H-X9-DG protein
MQRHLSVSGSAARRRRLTSGSRRAFTLVELLVVIGIIALLISILLPSLSNARKQANTVKCASNMKQLGMFAHMYANDNRNFIPRDYHRTQKGHVFFAEAFGKYALEDFQRPDVTLPGDQRDKLMQTEFRRIGVYQCPSFPRSEEVLCYIANAFQISTRVIGTGDAEPAINLSQVKTPAELVYLTEAHANQPGSTTPNYEQYDVWQPDQLSANGGKRMIDDDRHKMKANILYLDGHVDALPWKEMDEFKFKPRP